MVPEARADLKKLPGLKRAIKPAGAIWVIYPKGVKIITEADVRATIAAARKAFEALAA